LLLVGLLGRRRLRGLALAALLAPGCAASGPALDFNLVLRDEIYVATQSARVIMSDSSGAALGQAMQAVEIRPGLSVSKLDYDGEGLIDVVVDLAGVSPLDKINRLELVPEHLAAQVNVSLRAEVYDHMANRIAKLGGPSRAPA